MASPPVEPPPTNVRFPDPRSLRGDVVAIGCDFRPGTVLEAYRRGIFPWPQGDEADDGGEPLVAWTSPDPRALLPLDREPPWSRSLRRTLRRHPYEVTVDEDFAGVMRACGETRESTWIIPELVEGYLELHRLGWGHSLEVWERTSSGRELVGGIYGLAIGAAFVGESMFHKRTDTSKIAFAALAIRLRRSGFTIFDAQVMTPHLRSLGCEPARRASYLALLEGAIGRGDLAIY